jgi:hypothetical protein
MRMHNPPASPKRTAGLFGIDAGDYRRPTLRHHVRDIVTRAERRRLSDALGTGPELWTGMQALRFMEGFTASPPENRAPASFQLLASITRPRRYTSKDIAGRASGAPGHNKQLGYLPPITAAVSARGAKYPLRPRTLYFLFTDSMSMLRYLPSLRKSAGL